MENESELAQVLHFDLYGKREAKYNFLDQNSLKSIEWNTLTPQEPNFLFKNQNNELFILYNKGISIENLFVINATGVKPRANA
jgi:hypothetical protein